MTGSHTLLQEKRRLRYIADYVVLNLDTFDYHLVLGQSSGFVEAEVGHTPCYVYTGALKNVDILLIEPLNREYSPNGQRGG